MLPIRLELHNFLAYRNLAPINFDGIRLACLSGPNGAGKSSLLDAMTWALWGHARARGDDDLIHMGQEEMSVIFEFEQDGVRYRVQRERNRNGRGTLYLSVWNETDCKFENVIGGTNTRNQTQERITQILRLDYETFIHSAFVQQGKADAFTTAKPAARKETLSKILRLSDWEDHETRVKQKLQEITNELTQYNVLIQEREQQEADEPRLLSELEAAEQAVQVAMQAKEEAEARLEEVTGAAEALISAKKGSDDASRRIKAHQDALKNLNLEMERNHEQRDRYMKILEARESIEADYAQLQEARHITDEQTDKLMRQNEAEKELNLLQRQLDEIRADLERTVERVMARITEAERVIAAGEAVTDELTEIDAELASFDEQTEARETLTAQINEQSAQITRLKTHNEQINIELKKLRNRVKEIRSLGAVCPTCNQPLSKEQIDDLENQYTAEGMARKADHEANEASIHDAETQIADYRAQIEQLGADLRRRDLLNKNAGALRQKIEAAQHAADKLIEDRAELEEAQLILSTGDYGHDLQAQMTTLAAEIESVGYDKALYTEAKEAVSRLRDSEKQKQELEIASRSLPDLIKTLGNILEQNIARTAELKRDTDDLDHWKIEIGVLESRVQEQKRRQAEVTNRRLEEHKKRETQSTIAQQLKSIRDSRQYRLDLQARREALREDEAVYKELREAFSKNGVPAMIIEAAIPELENTTNRLLTRMTDGRMHVRFDTQRENKSGTVSETFDIKISDELGERDYEMFSGGEAFRINFALRIALSQFLAHRAGAKLQTLVIDEGFGSQDNVGRERLVEAINAISDDFDLILIVTHIDELRDQFPVHIEVSKMAGGSTVSIR